MRTQRSSHRYRLGSETTTVVVGTKAVREGMLNDDLLGRPKGSLDEELNALFTKPCEYKGGKEVKASGQLRCRIPFEGHAQLPAKYSDSTWVDFFRSNSEHRGRPLEETSKILPGGPQRSRIRKDPRHGATHTGGRRRGHSPKGGGLEPEPSRMVILFTKL